MPQFNALYLFQNFLFRNIFSNDSLLISTLLAKRSLSIYTHHDHKLNLLKLKFRSFTLNFNWQLYLQLFANKYSLIESSTDLSWLIRRRNFFFKFENPKLKRHRRVPLISRPFLAKRVLKARFTGEFCRLMYSLHRWIWNQWIRGQVFRKLFGQFPWIYWCCAEF